jgi:hypothetical protein
MSSRRGRAESAEARRENSEERGVTMKDFALELWAFTCERKKFWLLPIISILGLFGALIVVTQGSALAPFIYSLW